MIGEGHGPVAHPLDPPLAIDLSYCTCVFVLYTGRAKKLASTDDLIYQLIASYTRKALLVCMYINSGTTAPYNYRVVCAASSSK